MQCNDCSNRGRTVNSRKTNEKFITQFNILEHSWEYEILSKYFNSKTKINIKHLVCDTIYPIKPSKLLLGSKCPTCYGNNKKTTEEFKLEVYNLVNEEYDVLGEYINDITDILFRHNCDKCGSYEFKMRPSNFLNGQRCPVCNRKKLKSTEDYKKEVFNLVGDEYELLEEYKGSNIKIKIMHNCDKCNNHIYYVTPNCFLSQNSRCPMCNESKGEKRISEYLKNSNIISISEEDYRNIDNKYDKNIYYIPQKKFYDLLGIGNGNLSYDFYLPQYNLLIEYQGEFHDGSVNEGIQTKEDFEYQQEHDRRKKQYAEDNNIELLPIWYWDYDNIEEILDKVIDVIVNK